MLHVCVLNDGLKWYKHLLLAVFSYNNSYQQSIKMSPFEALYGRPYSTLLRWSESGERDVFGPNIAIEVQEKMKQIRANILTAQSHQKSYSDKRRCPLNLQGVPLSLPDERCTPLLYQRKTSSPLHWSVSYHRQVWTTIVSSGATIETIRSS
jgi:hypothetical protein